MCLVDAPYQAKRMLLHNGMEFVGIGKNTKSLWVCNPIITNRIQIALVNHLQSYLHDYYKLMCTNERVCTKHQFLKLDNFSQFFKTYSIVRLEPVGKQWWQHKSGTDTADLCLLTYKSGFLLE